MMTAHPRQHFHFNVAGVSGECVCSEVVCECVVCVVCVLVGGVVDTGTVVDVSMFIVVVVDMSPESKNAKYTISMMPERA
jgi:uncharacterized membrane protein YczE